MDLFKAKKLIRFGKLKPKKDPNPETNADPSVDETLKTESLPIDPPPKPDPDSNPVKNGAGEEEDEDDDDFITNEVKRRLKELRRNSFMVLIPEEPSVEEEEEEEETSSSSSGWKESEEAEDKYPWCGFDVLYDKYCERMLFFDKMSALQLQEPVCRNTPSPSPRSASKKLALTFRSLSFKKREDTHDEADNLHLEQKEDNLYQNLETAYVAHICLTWEALHCQYTQLCQIISSQPENPTSYSHAAQGFQQFHVLLQRFIENEPFEQCPRVEIYTRTRNLLPKLLQVPNFQGVHDKDKEDDYVDLPVLATDLRNIIEECILTFRCFLKTDKKKSGGVLNLFGGHNQVASSLHQIQASLDKPQREIKLKDLYRKKNGRNKKTWPATPEEAELLIGLIDIKVISRVLRMAGITKEQLLWCEEKTSKLDMSEGKLQRDGSPVLFPC
ncbi:hypothetical protein QJS04_geneDACA013974 [Acorus gramineus]|uniref:Uncharacterized protein n=1 Tax=Acorus gramineus TaxID=55184 RepID=A0AAV9AYR5_ACOGR|nr:hypothetical protein QJS04_geneDACA013974 [Acorus gramineus]